MVTQRMSECVKCGHAVTGWWTLVDGPYCVDCIRLDDVISRALALTEVQREILILALVRYRGR